MGQLAKLFVDGRQRRPEQATDEQKLYEQIGRLKMEVVWSKKKLPKSAKVKRQCFDRDHDLLSVSRPWQPLGVARSSSYYQPLGASEGT